LIEVYSDGASRGNPGPAAIGYAIYDRMENLLESNARLIGEATNNTTEYKALLWAMDQASSHCRKCVRFHSDSELIVRQINGIYRVKKEHLRDLLLEVYAKSKLFEKFEMIHLPRENPKIKEVDALVNAILDKAGFR